MGSMSDDDEPSMAPDDTLEHEAAEGQEHEDEELLRKLQSWEKQARQHWSQWRQEARRCYDFVAGHQWTQDDKAALLDQMRQPIVFNRTGPMVDAVIGAEILNRQEVRFIPREVGDVQVNEVITAANDWARDLCDAEDEESDAFSDVIVCGLGWTETRMDYEIDPDGTIRIDRVDPLEMWGDPSATKRNLADMRFCYRGRFRDKKELPKEWRTKISESNSNGEAEQSFGRGQTGPGDDYEHGDPETSGEDKNKGKVFIKHFQWYELEDGYKLSDEATGQTATMDVEEFRQIVLQFIQAGMQPPQAIKMKVRRYYQAFVCGDSLLEPKSRLDCDRFTFNCITGKRDRNTGTWYGIVRAMMDPQMWANKWLSQILHVLNTSASGGFFYEKDTFENPRKALEEWSKPNAAIEVKTGALARGALQEREAKNYPQGLDRLMEFAVNSMPQVTGINLELLGLVQKEQAGVLEAQRKQAGYAILAVFFDSLRRYRKMQGRVMLHYIQEYISDGRLIRIQGQNGNEQYVPLVRQSDTAKYDVIVDEAPMSANQKEAVWGMMTQMLPILTKQPVPMEVWQEFLRYSPLPSSVSTKIGQALADAAQPDPEQQQLQQAGAQLALRKEAATAAKDETQAVLNQARAAQATKQTYQQTLEPQQTGNRQ